MERLEVIQEELKQVLSPKRYEHSLGAMKQAEKLAMRYGVDVQKAKLAALVHDMAKEMPKEELLSYAIQKKLAITEIERLQPGLLHGKVAAALAKEKYGFLEDMQKAIAYHTTGNLKMDNLAKIIYIADKTEETRHYEEVEMVRSLAEKNLDECLLFILDFDICKNIKKGNLVEPESLFFRNELLKIKMKS